MREVVSSARTRFGLWLCRLTLCKGVSPILETALTNVEACANEESAVKTPGGVTFDLKVSFSKMQSAGSFRAHSTSAFEHPVQGVRVTALARLKHLHPRTATW